MKELARRIIQFAIDRRYVTRITTGETTRLPLYKSPVRESFQDFYFKVVHDTGLLQSEPEAYLLFSTVNAVQVAGVPGDIAEVGVYRGGSAKIISAANFLRRKVYLFDTFEGIPEVCEHDVDFQQGQFKSNYKEVKDYLSTERNVHIYKGVFPDTGRMLSCDRTFSFVHIDADSYKSIWDSLKFFYPRMCVGGVIIVHDYATSKSVRNVVNQFFAERVDPVLEMYGNQAMIVKVG